MTGKYNRDILEETENSNNENLIEEVRRSSRKITNVSNVVLLVLYFTGIIITTLLQNT